jgi:hypothetical protein
MWRSVLIRPPNSIRKTTLSSCSGDIGIKCRRCTCVELLTSSYILASARKSIYHFKLGDTSKLTHHQIFAAFAPYTALIRLVVSKTSYHSIVNTSTINDNAALQSRCRFHLTRLCPFQTPDPHASASPSSYLASTQCNLVSSAAPYSHSLD